VQQISPAPHFPSAACCCRRDARPNAQQLAAANGPFFRAEFRSENFSTLSRFINVYRYFTYAGAPAYLMGSIADSVDLLHPFYGAVLLNGCEEKIFFADGMAGRLYQAGVNGCALVDG